MPTRGGLADVRLAGLAVAALVTTVAIASFDLFAGEPPVHALTAGMVGVAAALMRSQVLGCPARWMSTVSACIVAQPIVHVGAKWLPQTSAAPGHGLGLAEFAVIGTQVAAVLCLVALIAVVELLITLLVGAIRVCWLAVTHVIPDLEPFTAPTRAPACASLVSWLHWGPTARRGPPRSVLATA